jgi:hypothetical protein
MKLKMSKGIQDFNRALAILPGIFQALAIIPGIFQAYLSRACYYGTKGNYTKVTLSYNEAIKQVSVHTCTGEPSLYSVQYLRANVCRVGSKIPESGLFRAVFG